MTFDTCKHPWYHHHNQGNRHIQNIPKFPCLNHHRKMLGLTLRVKPEVILSPPSLVVHFDPEGANKGLLIIVHDITAMSKDSSLEVVPQL